MTGKCVHSWKTYTLSGSDFKCEKCQALGREARYEGPNGYRYVMRVVRRGGK